MKIMKKPAKWVINQINRIKKQNAYSKRYGYSLIPEETVEELMERSGAYYFLALTEEGKKYRPQRSWSYLPKQGVDLIQRNLAGNYRKSYSIVTPRRDVVVIYRKPESKVFVVDEPRVPPFALILHHHGSQSSAVDEEYKCVRCGAEVPAAVKSLVMMEANFGVTEK